VEGLFSENPHLNPNATLVEKIDYTGAEALLEHEKRPLLHIRALILAKKLSVPLEILSYEKGSDLLKAGTVIQENTPLKKELVTSEL
jgi:aspartokinase